MKMLPLTPRYVNRRMGYKLKYLHLNDTPCRWTLKFLRRRMTRLERLICAKAFRVVVMKFVYVITDEYMKTGQIIDKCIGCEHALIVEGDNVEPGGILFCRKFFDFPVKRIKVRFIPDRTTVKYTEIFYCDRTGRRW